MEALTPYNTQHKITFQFSVQKFAPPYFLDPNKLKHLMRKIKTVFSPPYCHSFALYSLTPTNWKYTHSASIPHFA